MVVLDDSEQVAAALGGELGEAEVVDEQDLGLGERGEPPGRAAIGACDGQLAEQARQAAGSTGSDAVSTGITDHFGPEYAVQGPDPFGL